MPNYVKQRMTYAGAMLTATLLTACALPGEPRQAPAYASMMDADTYRVICMGASPKEIYVRYDALDTFLHQDGSEKTRAEFCQDGRYGAISS